MASLLTELENQIKAYDREFMRYSEASVKASARNDTEQQHKWLYAALQSAANGRQAKRRLAELLQLHCNGAEGN